MGWIDLPGFTCIKINAATGWANITHGWANITHGWAITSPMCLRVFSYQKHLMCIWLFKITLELKHRVIPFKMMPWNQIQTWTLQNEATCSPNFSRWSVDFPGGERAWNLPGMLQVVKQFFFGGMNIYLASLCDLFGMGKWPFQRLSDLQIGDEKVTLNHLVAYSSHFSIRWVIPTVNGGTSCRLNWLNINKNIVRCWHGLVHLKSHHHTSPIHYIDLKWSAFSTC